MHDVDVVIIGAGVAGLSVLRKLRVEAAELSVVLIVGDLGMGGGQTCHSHAMLHRGHYEMGRFKVDPAWLAEMAGDLSQRLAAHLRQPDPLRNSAAERVPHFEDLLALGSLSWEQAGAPVIGDQPRGKNRVGYLDQIGGRSSHLRTTWKPQERTSDVPVGFDLWRVDEDWVDPCAVTRWLVDSHELRPFMVNGVAALHRERGHVVVTAGTEKFRTRQVVVATGEANERLLRELAPDHSASLAHLYVKPVLYELIMRGPAGSGPSICGMSAGGIRWNDGLPHAGLLSSHAHGDERTWVFTDGVNIAGRDVSETQWLRRVLRVLFDQLHTVPRRVRWAIRRSDMFELRREFDDPRALGHWTIERLPSDDGVTVLFVWPTKLTLAPLLADDVFARLERTPTHPQPPVAHQVDAFAVAPWDEDEFFLRGWFDFATEYGVADMAP